MPLYGLSVFSLIYPLAVASPGPVPCLPVISLVRHLGVCWAAAPRRLGRLECARLFVN